jgi:hypothetical protein
MLIMLKLLFGSSLRAGLVTWFIKQPDAQSTLEQLGVELRFPTKKIAPELASLVDMGLVEKLQVDGESVWRLNIGFPLLPEFKSLIYKAVIVLEQRLAQQLAALKGIQLLILTGVFNSSDVPTDIFVVGTVDKKAVEHVLNKLGSEFQDSLRYTILTKSEFTYRKEMTDKFVYQVLNIRPILVINKLI